jgi:hypothetical protein
VSEHSDRYLILDSDARRVGRVRRIGRRWHAWRRIGGQRQRARFPSPGQAVRWAAEGARRAHISGAGLPTTAWILSPIACIDGLSLHHVVPTSTLQNIHTLRLGPFCDRNIFRGRRGGIALQGRTLVFRWRDNPKNPDEEDTIMPPTFLSPIPGNGEILHGPRHRSVAAAAARVLVGLAPCRNDWPAGRHLRLHFAGLARPLLNALEASPRPPALRIQSPPPLAACSQTAQHLLPIKPASTFS